jgi:2-polyprenyl-6-methoxyphenol hydroxylase-like FAD-dependent oxidoreductase
MPPIGGVGINLAIQDPVAAGNVWLRRSGEGPARPAIWRPCSDA